MKLSKLHTFLLAGKVYDVNFHTTADTSNGMKLSLQGKCINDALFLFERLDSFLLKNNVPFKVGTQKRFSHNCKEQSKKAMTIYIPNGVDAMNFAEEVYTRIMDYKGWYDIKTPTSYEHYAGGVFFRNDRNEKGLYIPAQSKNI